MPREVRERRLGAKELPLYSGPDAPVAMAHPHFVMDAIETGNPYPVKAMIVVGTNPLLTMQDSGRVMGALRKLDFLVTLDLFMTPTAELSDLVLPVACWLERDGIPGSPSYPYCVSICHRAVEPLYQRRSDAEILIELAKRMGLNFPWKSEEEYNNYRLAPSGLVFEELRKKNVNYITMPKTYEKYKESGFWTPSKKFEFYSTLLEKYGFDPLPDHVPPAQTSDEYPLIWLTGNRLLEYSHSQGRQIPMLRLKHPEPEISIHPDTARKLGIENGEMVFIETPYGKEKKVWMVAKLTEDVHPRMVVSQHGWWYPEKPGPLHGCFESNVNFLLTLDEYDPIGGSAHTRDIPCRIKPAKF
ncbi:MAG: molybdopterin-containing oxidoreductase family protein [Candidatus Hadarchaeum sp.]|uniref:molybdopterin-containing oxidoreductase family protein n=1 Tax=Candidatus Hadarchaeum sp. TaxID=2883567 RepID=UPI003D0ED642